MVFVVWFSKQPYLFYGSAPLFYLLGSKQLGMLIVLLIAASLEAGGDALVRWGLSSGRILGFVLGAVVLFSYGVVVNLPKWDFGRLLGVYIVLFFIVSQLLAVVVFRETIPTPRIVGGLLVIAGGIVMTVWQR